MHSQKIHVQSSVHICEFSLWMVFGKTTPYVTRFRCKHLYICSINIYNIDWNYNPNLLAYLCAQISILEGGLGLGSPPPTRPATTPGPKEENRKKESGGTLSSCLRQKLSSVICATDNKGSASTAVAAKKRDVTSGTLYNLLAACLDNMPDGQHTQPVFYHRGWNKLNLLMY